jgi:pimeloyl-ACP methyl ester carboxylesterase
MGHPEELSADGAHLIRIWNSMYRWRDPAAPLELVQAHFTETLRGGELRWWGHNAAFQYHHAEQLPKVLQPVLVLCPEDDLVTPTRRAKDYITNGTFLELPGKSHGMLEIYPQEIAAIIRDFVDNP